MYDGNMLLIILLIIGVSIVGSNGEEIEKKRKLFEFSMNFGFFCFRCIHHQSHFAFSKKFPNWNGKCRFVDLLIGANWILGVSNVWDFFSFHSNSIPRVARWREKSEFPVEQMEKRKKNQTEKNANDNEFYTNHIHVRTNSSSHMAMIYALYTYFTVALPVADADADAYETFSSQSDWFRLILKKIREQIFFSSLVRLIGIICFWLKEKSNAFLSTFFPLSNESRKMREKILQFRSLCFSIYLISY